MSGRGLKRGADGSARAAGGGAPAAAVSVTVAPPRPAVRHRFRPSRQQAAYLNFIGVGDGAAEGSKPLALRPADDNKWEGLAEDVRTKLVAETVRAVVLRAHSGQAMLDVQSLKSALEAKGLAMEVTAR